MRKQQKRKLKTSCNSCSSAKVRCEKNQSHDPSAASNTCLRCAQQNLKCVYDVSQRKGKPFKLYQRSELHEVPQNVDGEHQDFDNNSTTPTETNSTYPWPKTGWNLSDVGPAIDFSSVFIDLTGGSGSVLTRQHDIYTVMADASSQLSALDNSINDTFDTTENMQQSLTGCCAIRNLLLEVLNCRCHTCTNESSMVFLLATLGSKLSDNYKNISTRLALALQIHPVVGSNAYLAAAHSLRLEINQFQEICQLIREKMSSNGESKAVGEAFYEMLHGRVERLLSSLNGLLAKQP